MVGMDYETFLRSKANSNEQFGFSPIHLPSMLFPFQKHVCDWAIRKGRAAILEDCGLGKSAQELTWADNVLRKENKAILLLTPIAVGPQMVLEGEKFGIECKQVRNGKIYKGINITNYEQIHKYDPASFAAVVADESSILKSHTGATRKRVTEFLSKVKYRLLATATPCPNDYMELGTASEALGMMPRSQMLGMFFANDGETTQKWNLKGHARKRFWRWVCTWARSLRKPSDLGFSDDGFVLPKLTMEQHIVQSNRILKGLDWRERRH